MSKLRLIITNSTSGSTTTYLWSPLQPGSWHLPSWDHLRHTCLGIHLCKGPSFRGFGLQVSQSRMIWQKRQLIAASRGIELRLHVLRGLATRKSVRVFGYRPTNEYKAWSWKMQTFTSFVRNSESAKPGFSVHNIPTLVQSFPMLYHSQDCIIRTLLA